MQNLNIVSILVGVVGLIAAFVASLLSKNRALKDQLGELQYGSKLREDLLRKSEQEKKADEQETNYGTVRDTYIKQHGSDGSTDE